MNLTDLLAGIVADSEILDDSFELKGLALDSRKVVAGTAFLAVAGAKEHGLVYLNQAIKKGAVAVIYDPQGSEAFNLENVDIIQVAIANLTATLGLIADRFYQSPSRQLQLIGITGTNGKTSCSQFLAQLLPNSGVIGTLGWGENGDLQKTLNTTPDALDVQEILAHFVSLKKQNVVMEVSSHGLQQGRVNDVVFKGAVFTNLSRDHLDYHGSMEQYFQAKLVLFKQAGLQFVVVNSDDSHSQAFLEASHQKVKRWAFSASGKKTQVAENVLAEDVLLSLDGISFYLCYRNERQKVKTTLVGDFNLENILAVITVLLALGESFNEVVEKVSRLQAVDGRMQRFGGNGKPVVFVDYAHTPDALDKVLQGLKKHCQHKLWVVFGCGGDRDKGKRSQMGLIAEKQADQVIVTNDNPRFEDETLIIEDIVAGRTAKNIDVIQDRKQAIQTVIDRADKKDCIVIAGKGHESYQDVMGVKQPFNDKDEVLQALHERT